MRYLRTIDNLLERIESGLVVFCFSALVVLIGFNILIRNLFGVSFRQILQLSPGIVLWLALLGSTLALKRGRHIRIELFLRFCPPGVRRAAGGLAGLFGTAVTAVLFRASLQFVANEAAMFGTWGWIAIIFPVFFGICCFRFLLSVLDPSGSFVAPGAAPGIGGR